MNPALDHIFDALYDDCEPLGQLSLEMMPSGTAMFVLDTPQESFKQVVTLSGTESGAHIEAIVSHIKRRWGIDI